MISGIFSILSNNIRIESEPEQTTSLITNAPNMGGTLVKVNNVRCPDCHFFGCGACSGSDSTQCVDSEP